MPEFLLNPLVQENTAQPSAATEPTHINIVGNAPPSVIVSPEISLLFQESSTEPKTAGERLTVDASSFDSIQAHAGDLKTLLKQAEVSGQPIGCPFIQSLGAKGIELAQKWIAQEANPNKGPTLRELLAQKRAQETVLGLTASKSTNETKKAANTVRHTQPERRPSTTPKSSASALSSPLATRDSGRVAYSYPNDAQSQGLLEHGQQHHKLKMSLEKAAIPPEVLATITGDAKEAGSLGVAQPIQVKDAAKTVRKSPPIKVKTKDAKPSAETNMAPKVLKPASKTTPITSRHNSLKGKDTVEAAILNPTIPIKAGLSLLYGTSINDTPSVLYAPNKSPDILVNTGLTQPELGQTTNIQIMTAHTQRILKPDFEIAASAGSEQLVTKNIYGSTAELLDFELWEAELTGDVPEVVDHELSYVLPTDSEIVPDQGSATVQLDDETEFLANNTLDLFDTEASGAPVNADRIGIAVVGSLFEIAESSPDEAEAKTEELALNAENQTLQNVLNIEDQPIQSVLTASIKVEPILSETLAEVGFDTLSFEPAHDIEAAQKSLGSIVLLVHELLSQPDKPALEIIADEEILQQLCEDLFIYIRVEYKPQTIKLFIKNVRRAVESVLQKGQVLNLLELSRQGTHEHKFRHSFTPTKLAKTIRQKFHQQISIGRYILQNSIN